MVNDMAVTQMDNSTGVPNGTEAVDKEYIDVEAYGFAYIPTGFYVAMLLLLGTRSHWLMKLTFLHPVTKEVYRWYFGSTIIICLIVILFFHIKGVPNMCIIYDDPNHRGAGTYNTYCSYSKDKLDLFQSIFVMACIHLPFSYIITMIHTCCEAWETNVFRNIDNQIKFDDVYMLLDNLINTKPHVQINCYQKGEKNMSLLYSEELTEAVSQWKDNSPESPNILSFSRDKITLLKVNSLSYFTCSALVDTIKNTFLNTGVYHPPEKMNKCQCVHVVGVYVKVKGYEKYLLLNSGSLTVPWWISCKAYVICTILGLSLPYQMLMRLHCRFHKQQFLLEKQILDEDFWPYRVALRSDPCIPFWF